MNQMMATGPRSVYDSYQVGTIDQRAASSPPPYLRSFIMYGPRLLLICMVFTNMSAAGEPKKDKAPGKPGSFAGRKGDMKTDLILAGGGTAASDAAVFRGLSFLLRMQQADGGWRLDDKRF